MTAKKLAQIAKLAKAKLGVPNPPGPSGKGPENRFSKYWAFLAPNHTIMEGWNLNELVRANAHMFDPEDVVWKGKGSSNCRAVKGLSSLYGGRVNNCVSWKGWTAMTDAETRREYAMRKARGEG